MAGKARQGKDTVGKNLARKIGYRTYSFAEPIKRITNSLFGWDYYELFEDCKEVPREVFIDDGSIAKAVETAQRYGLIDYCLNHNKEFSISEIFKVLRAGSTEKGLISPRVTWQLFGTEWGRLLIDKDIWVDLMPEEGVVVLDIRFDNEAKKIRELGGTIIQVYRTPDDLAEGMSGHASEQGLTYEEEDIFFDNTGNLASLNSRVDLMIRDNFI